jgi:dienelactone hydrolase
VVIARRRFLKNLGVAAGVFWSRDALVAGGAQNAAGAPRLHHTLGRDFAIWQKELRRELVEILALPSRQGAPLDGKLEAETEHDGYRMQRLRFTAEPGEVVPGYLLRPKNTPSPHPVMICLQGHTPGMHISIGQARNEREKDALSGGRDLALQAVARGWAALVIEQRAFGERAERNVSCNDAALRALHRGRPLTGQRVFDVMRAIDFAATQPGLDVQRLGCMGNSTGGTVSFYAACVDPRIELAVVSCSFCTFEDSWLSLPHCACGYLPGIMQAADMPDLAGLIAPRRLLIVAGRKDSLARYEGVEKGFRRAQEIFAAGGAANRVRLVAGDGGHQFYPELAWPVVAEMMAR